MLLLPLVGVSIMRVNGADWRTADRSSSGIAPRPAEHREAVIQVYAARTFGWRGALAVHTWIATKERDAENYMVHQVVGWRKRRNLSVVVSEVDIPDRIWFDNYPEVLVDIRGQEAEPVIDAVLEAVRTYPHADDYSMWPGPNSNTFTAYIGRQVPSLKLNLPPTAIGKDFLVDQRLVAPSPSGTGHQLSVYGLLGLILSKEEGFEVNVLGLNFGINPMKFNLRLPGFGIIGPEIDQEL